MMAFGGVNKSSPVSMTPELRRVISLPRRQPIISADDVVAWSESLRRNGSVQLRPIQALALHDAYHAKGLFGAIAVGEGKTLISALAPQVLSARRPLLITLGNLVNKTRNEFSEYAKNWHIHPGIQIRSYELISQPNGKQTLELLRPDLIVFDECHKLKNLKGSAVRRIVRYLQSYPETQVVAMSGTIAKNGIQDFAHVLVWCLKTLAPVPIPRGEVLAWSEAIDDFIGERRPMGALSLLSNPPATDLESLRRAFQDRLSSSLGVVCSPPTELACSLRISEVAYTPSPSVQSAYQILRSEGRAPDGYAFSESLEMLACARQLAMGFAYVHDPRPPQWWLDARLAWARFVREVLQHSRKYDSEATVRYAVEAGEIKSGQTELAGWLNAKQTFATTSKTIWIDDQVINIAAKWLEKNKGIVWTEHSAFALRLAQRTGFPYYGQGGLDARGQSIDTAPAGPCIASIRANSAGRNIQDRWSSGLVVSPPTNGKDWQQLLGRLHRIGQPADEVTFDVLVGCHEHVHAMARAREGAIMQRDLVGDLHKLLSADYIPITGRQDLALPSMQSNSD